MGFVFIKVKKKLTQLILKRVQLLYDFKKENNIFNKKIILSFVEIIFLRSYMLMHLEDYQW